MFGDKDKVEAAPGEGRVLAKVIIEMLGAPKEHIEKTLKDYIDKLKQSEGIQIVKEDYADAVEQGKFFSAFVEMDVWFKGLPKLFEFCFEAMPSSIEIIEPTELSMDARELSGIANELQSRLHEVDMVLKDTNAKNQLMDKNAMKILQNFIAAMLEDGGKSPEEMSGRMGIEAKALAKFLEFFEKKGALKRENDKYTLTKQ